jgi:enoyl-CoA hydratase/carnithine racemase
MSSVVSYELIDTIGVITVNNPPVNALSQALRQGLLDAITAAQKDASEALVLLCAGRTFIAGADITEFGKPPVAPFLAEVLAALENSRKLIVAAIHGTALGGGFETALACHYRCAVPSARVGLPEVKLGLLPGAGGTQRLPRVVGAAKALDMIVTGSPIKAEEAAKLGYFDRLIDGDLIHNPVWDSDRVRTFAIRGDFRRFSRGELARFIEEAGGRIDAEPKVGTDFLVAGAAAESWTEAAVKLGVSILSEDQLLDYIRPQE